MDPLPKPVDELSICDIARSPVWEFIMDQEEELGETRVRPVTELPVTTLANRIVGTRLGLHNATECWAILGNISLTDARRTRQFLAASVEKDGPWFYLARYFDADYQERGPDQLATFLGMSTEEVFPMTYDLSMVAVGVDEVVKGTILREPQEKLTDEELLRMCLERAE